MSLNKTWFFIEILAYLLYTYFVDATVLNGEIVGCGGRYVMQLYVGVEYAAC